MHLNEYVRATKSYVLFFFAIYLISPILSPYVKSMGLSDFQISLVFAILPLSIAIFAPIVGRISDKIGRDYFMYSAVIVELLSIILYLLANSPALIIIARTIDSIGIATMIVVGLAKIEDTLDGRARGRYSGLTFSFMTLGKVSGPLIGGFLADYLFIKAPFVLAGILLLLIIKIPKRANSKRVALSDFNWLRDIKEFLKYRQLKGIALLGIVFHASIPAFMVFLPLLIKEQFHLSYIYIGMAFFAFYFARLFQSVFGRWSDKNPSHIITLGAVISGVFSLLLFWAYNYWTLILLVFLKGIGESMWNVSAWTFMSRIGERHRIEGEVIGSYLSIAKIGSFLSFLVSGLVVQLYGIKYLFLIAGILLLFGIAVAYQLIKGNGKSEVM